MSGTIHELAYTPEQTHTVADLYNVLEGTETELVEGRMISEISHFRVIEKIGEGGMGLVYRARDDRLDRDVAIKVLPDAVSRDPDRLRRFEHEARAAGALNHPNILTVYDIGEHEGRPFIVTELLKGDTLHTAIPRKGLSPERAVELAMQIAAGLAAAHESGIVHRDLKPSNIFVTRDGYLKILDFGLAKLKPRTGPDSATAVMTEESTATGTILGTIGYMSPEQVRGQTTDSRTDIFSFGCVLYELLCGQRAFTGSTPADVISAVLSEQPEDSAVVNPEVPEELARLVMRCLEKRPEDRFQSARDVLHALEDLSVARRVQPPGPAPTRWLTPRRTAFFGFGLLIAAIAVAYLWRPTPLLGFSERDWILVSDFAHPEGETDLANALKLALTVGLQESGYINVINRSQIADVLQMMERPPDTAIDAATGLEICQRASLKGLLTPEVARVGSGYLVTANLVEPASEATVASFSARSKDDDGLLDALDELLSRLRDGLGDSLSSLGQDQRPLAAVTTGSLEALKLYTQGLRAWRDGKYQDAVGHYKEAIAIDPDFASAYAALGSAYSTYVFRERELAAENFEAALDRLDRVGRRELNFIRSQYAGFLGHQDERIRFLELHLSEYPDDTSAHFNLGACYRDIGQYEQCVAQYTEILRVEPRHAGALINLATCLSVMNKTGPAITAYRQAFEIQPEWEVTSNLNHEYGVSLLRAGMFADARELFEKRLARPEPDNRGHAHRSLGQLELYRGQFEAAIDHFRQAATLHTAAGYPTSIARDHIFEAFAEIGRGRMENAVAALATAEDIMPSDAGSLPFHINIAMAYLAAGNVDEARRILDTLMPRAGEDDQVEENTVRSIHVLEGRVLLAAGDVGRAIEVLEQEARVAARPNPDLYEGLAEAYRAENRWPESEVALRRLIEIRWDTYEGLVPWVTSHFVLGEVCEHIGKTEDAAAWYQQFVDLWGNADTELPQIELARNRLEVLGG